MHNFPLSECISQADPSTTTKGAAEDEKGYVKVEQTVTYQAHVHNIDDATRWMRLGVGAGYHTEHGPYQRALNDELAWLVEASARV